MKKKVLIINLCSEWLHYHEFVKPIEDILKNSDEKYFVRNYLDLDKKDIEKTSKIIICGTPLNDDFYMQNIKKFEFIKKLKIPLLGICAGCQIINLIFGGEVSNRTDIGMLKVNFQRDLLGIKKGDREVYNLHNYSLSKIPDDFEIFSGEEKNESVQAIKHKKNQIYGVMFHPEVRNKEFISNFLKMN